MMTGCCTSGKHVQDLNQSDSRYVADPKNKLIGQSYSFTWITIDKNNGCLEKSMEAIFIIKDSPIEGLGIRIV